MIRSLFTLILALSFSLPALAQDLELPAPSPKASVMQTVGTTEITVTYSSPGKKDRDIFGGLVPFDELWRTGANAATTIEFSSAVTVADTAVPAGKYAVFTIPGKAGWTVILNTNSEQGGTRDYDEALDAVRFAADPMEAPVRERMTFLFQDTTPAGTTLVLDWAGTSVNMPIKVDSAGIARDAVNAYANSAAGRLARAARYMAEEQKDLDTALTLADASVALDRSWFNVWIKATILRARGDNKPALKLAQEAWELGNKAEFFFYKSRVEAALTDWKKKK